MRHLNVFPAKRIWLSIRLAPNAAVVETDCSMFVAYAPQRACAFCFEIRDGVLICSFSFGLCWMYDYGYSSECIAIPQHYCRACAFLLSFRFESLDSQDALT